MFVGELERGLSVVVEGKRPGFLVAPLTLFSQRAAMGVVFSMTADARCGLRFELLLRVAGSTFDFAVKSTNLKCRLFLMIKADGIP